MEYIKRHIRDVQDFPSKGIRASVESDCSAE